MKICHLTSVHQQEDIRIFHKECISLVNAGYETYLVSTGKDYEKAGVHLIGVGAPLKGRISRMIKTARKVYLKGLQLDADIYHVHDPELLPFARKLKKKGKKVIFDSHEDVPAQIMDKKWIPYAFRKIVSKTYKRYETSVTKQIDAVIAATPHIANQFSGRAKRIFIINNYPKLDDIVFQTKPFSQRKRQVCYAGGINEIRGEKMMVEAMKESDAVLVIAGKHDLKEIGTNEKNMI